MIDGLGIDIEEVARFAVLLQRWGRSFTEKIFSAGEIAYCEAKHSPQQHFAARFAAKEAFAKALGTGWRGQFAWKDVEIVNDEQGKPALRFHDTLSRHMSDRRVEVSLSHTKQYVAAVVLIHHETAESVTTVRAQE
jgi:holo-[acyl-carrier protein] synthase